jgi:hypothetical protein
MPAKRKRKPTRAPRLHSSLAEAIPHRIPKRWVKTPVAILLLLPAWILTRAFFDGIARSSPEFTSREEFHFFAVGGLIGLALFFGLRQLTILYVLGHELTHTLWVWLHGGTIEEFRVRDDGGHIVTNKTNTWIILAPYFFPIYAVLWAMAYGIAVIGLGVPPSPGTLFAGIGFGWAFHIAYTIWMIAKGQSDIAYGGVPFSLAVIYIANLAVLSTLLVAASPSLTWRAFAGDLAAAAMDASAFLVDVARATGDFLFGHTR